MKNEITTAIADRLMSAEPAADFDLAHQIELEELSGEPSDPLRPTPRDLHAMEHGGYHVPHVAPQFRSDWEREEYERDRNRKALYEHLDAHGVRPLPAPPLYGRSPAMVVLPELRAMNEELSHPDADKSGVTIEVVPGCFAEVSQKEFDQREAEKRAQLALAKADAHLPTDAKARKDAPIYSGVMRYFPDALVAVAQCSKIANDQHNPGEPMHWAKEKSNDHHDCITRHMLDAGTMDTDGVRHSTKVAWRALAALQIELDKAKENGQ